MAYEKILKDIKAKNFKPVYVLHGEEGFFIDELTNAIIDNALQTHEKDFNLSVFYGKETTAKDVIDAARRFPMMAERQVVVLKEAQGISSDLKNFEAYVDSIVPSTVLVINHKDKKVDGRLGFLKKAKKVGEVFYSEPLKEAKAKVWIKNLIAESGIDMEAKALEMMYELIGTNISKAKIEVQKLVPNIVKGQKVNSAMIQKYIGVHAEYNIYELQKALAIKDANKAYKIAKFYSGSKKTVIQMVLVNLFYFYNKLLIYLQLSGRPEMEKTKAMKLYNSYQLSDYKLAAKYYDIPSVLNSFELIHHYDLESKGVGVSGKSDWEIYKELIFKLLS